MGSSHVNWCGSTVCSPELQCVRTLPEGMNAAVYSIASGRKTTVLNQRRAVSSTFAPMGDTLTILVVSGGLDLGPSRLRKRAVKLAVGEDHTVWWKLPGRPKPIGRGRLLPGRRLFRVPRDSSMFEAAHLRSLPARCLRLILRGSAQLRCHFHRLRPVTASVLAVHPGFPLP